MNSQDPETVPTLLRADALERQGTLRMLRSLSLSPTLARSRLEPFLISNHVLMLWCTMVSYTSDEPHRVCATAIVGACTWPLLIEICFSGDYISYMTPQTKDARRAEWKSFNFAGTVDWAVDLQQFTAQEMRVLPQRPESGEGCTSGEGITLDSGDLCDFTCLYGFCPESVCTCHTTGQLLDLPTEKTGLNIVAWDELNVELNRLCIFACRYNYCPEEICTTPIDGPDESGPHRFGEDFGNGEDPGYYNKTAAKLANDQACIIYKDPAYNDVSKKQCKPICQDALDEAAEEGRTSNYGCIGFYPMEKSIPWERAPGAGSQLIAPGKCLCDNFLLNELADTVLEAMPMIAQVRLSILDNRDEKALCHLTIP